MRDVPPFDYWFGDVVFLRVADERKPGMVTRIMLSPNTVAYCVTWAMGGETSHYAFELTSEFVPTFDTYQGSTKDHE